VKLRILLFALAVAAMAAFGLFTQASAQQYWGGHHWGHGGWHHGGPGGYGWRGRWQWGEDEDCGWRWYRHRQAWVCD
jgi:Spy/CpxP family protein refolding chaperone